MNAQHAANGRALAEAIKAEAPAAAGRGEGATLESLGAGEQRDAAASIAARHAEAAKRLFPWLSPGSCERTRIRARTRS